MLVSIDICLDEIKQFLSVPSRLNLVKIQRKYRFDENLIISKIKEFGFEEPIDIESLDVFLFQQWNEV